MVQRTLKNKTKSNLLKGLGKSRFIMLKFAKNAIFMYILGIPNIAVDAGFEGFQHRITRRT